MKARLRLLLLSALLTGAVLLSAAAPAVSECVFYCWHVDANTTCCQTEWCEIVC